MPDNRPASSPHDGAPPWRARLFGGFTLATPGGASATPAGRKARALLAYLILTEAPATRERLAGLLWGDRGPDQARASVRQALYELRGLSEGDGALLRVDRVKAQITRDRVSSDLGDLRALGDGADATGFAALMGEEPQDLLSDLDDVDPGFDEWLGGQRVRRREERQALGAAVAVRALAAGDAAGASRLAAALVAAEPFDEAAVSLALRSRAALGDRAGVRQAFRQYAQAVRAELGIEPSADLAALEARLSAEEPPSPPRRVADALPPDVGTLETPEIFAVRPRRWIGRPVVVASILIVGLIAAGLGGWTWWQGRDRPRVLRVEALATPAGDAPAQSLRVGLSADLARLILGNDARLVVEDPNDRAQGAGRRADYVFTGEARSGAGMLQATLRLLNGRNGAILWSKGFSRPVAEAESLRAQIADRAADVGICAEGGRKPPPDLDDETLRLYLEGCEQKHGDWKLSAQLLGEVVRRRPDFAHAWAMYAAATAAASPDGPPGATGRQQADAYARRAIALDPSEGEAWDARAQTLPGPSKWLARSVFLHEGHRRDPDSSIVAIDLAFDDTDAGYRDEAGAYALSAVQHDPFSQVMASQYIRLVGLSGDVDAARALVKAAARHWPDDPYIADAWFRVATLSGDPDEALKLIDHPGFDIKPVEQAAWRAVLRYRRAPGPDARAAAGRATEAMVRQDGADGLIEAIVQSVLMGDLDTAYAYASTVPDRSLEARRVLFYAAMAPFRADPRFMALAGRQGLVEVWRRTGRWPDFCVAHDRPYNCAQAAAAAGF